MYTCTCPCGFTGTRCEIRVSFCSSNTSYCQNGATCVENQPCAVSCICPRGYYGTTCNILKNVFIGFFFILINFYNLIWNFSLVYPIHVVVMLYVLHLHQIWLNTSVIVYLVTQVHIVKHKLTIAIQILA